MPQQEKKEKKAKNVALVLGKLQTLSNLFFLLISMVGWHASAVSLPL